MYRIQNIEYIYAFAAIPLVVLVFILAMGRKKRAMRLFGEYSIVSQLSPDISIAKPVIKVVLLCLAFAALITGIINPQIGSKLSEVKREGADIMICLDVSNSMRAEDFSPNRLDRARQSISKLLDKLEGDRIGLIVFAGEAYVQLPITTDYSAGKLFLENIDCGMVPAQGTAIAPAIELAMESFGSDVGKNKAIIIISDGEDHEAAAAKAAGDASAKGIVVHTIGIGSPAGAPIPEYADRVQTGFKKDKDGNTIVTRLNEQNLEDIASSSGGVYVRATGSETGLNTILSEIGKLDKKQFDSKMYTDYDDKFHYFIAAALLLFCLEAFFSGKKSKLFSRLNLFGEEK